MKRVTTSKVRYTSSKRNLSSTCGRTVYIGISPSNHGLFSWTKATKLAKHEPSVRGTVLTFPKCQVPLVILNLIFMEGEFGI